MNLSASAGVPLAVEAGPGPPVFAHDDNKAILAASSTTDPIHKRELRQLRFILNLLKRSEHFRRMGWGAIVAFSKCGVTSELCVFKWRFHGKKLRKEGNRKAVLPFSPGLRLRL